MVAGAAGRPADQPQRRDEVVRDVDREVDAGRLQWSNTDMYRVINPFPPCGKGIDTEPCDKGSESSVDSLDERIGDSDDNSDHSDESVVLEDEVNHPAAAERESSLARFPEVNDPAVAEQEKAASCSTAVAVKRSASPDTEGLVQTSQARVQSMP